MTTKGKFIIAAILSAIALTPAAASALVAPTGLGAVEGNSGSRNLFGFINVARYQQVYGSNQFLGGPITISGLALRANGANFGGIFGGPGTSFTRTIADARFTLSTTSRAVDGLSTSFSANTGADAVDVLRGSVTYSTAAGSANGLTKDFDVLFNFTTPFSYDPGRGNLLLDVTSFSGGDRSGTTLDAQSVLGDSVSSLFLSNGTSGTGTLGTIGYVTEFQLAGAVPEPATWAMLILGFGIVGGTLRSRARRPAALA